VVDNTVFEREGTHLWRFSRVVAGSVPVMALVSVLGISPEALGSSGIPAELAAWGPGRGRAPGEIVFLAVDVDVEADDGAVDDESARAERSTGGEARGQAGGDLLQGG